MQHPCSFQLPETAPHDGSVIEVRHGARQTISKARWSRINHAFVDIADPRHHTIGGVTGWRRPVVAAFDAAAALESAERAWKY
jgi:hypothetical protein